MVTEINKIVYVCPYCWQEHATLLDIEACWRYQANIDKPVRKQISAFACEMCNCEYPTRELAGECEEHHIDKEDLFYTKFYHKLEMEKLAVAAKLPGQKTLN